MRQQRLLRLGRQAQAAQAETRAILFEEIPRQQQHVTAALTQRRHRQRVDTQAVVQIGAKTPGAYLGGEVTVGGGDHPHVDTMLAVRADPLQLPALQHAQQLGLHRQWQLADLVEEQAAAVGQLELATALVHRAGEGATHVAEQLAFHQRIGQRSAVEADQRPPRTR